MIIYEDLHLVPAYAKTHGVLMSLTFLIVFPLGAWTVRLMKSSKRVWVHASLQILGWVMMLAGLAVGIRMGTIIDRLENNAHTVLGTVVVVLMILQPFIGVVQHLLFRRKQKTTIWNHIHKWYGRTLVILGMINGGLGLRLANDTTGGTIAYGVVAGVSGAAFLGLIVWSGPNESDDGRDIPLECGVKDDTAVNGIE